MHGLAQLDSSPASEGNRACNPNFTLNSNVPQFLMQKLSSSAAFRKQRAKSCDLRAQQRTCIQGRECPDLKN
eukprot:1157219-Pelagomonas_calceolata.AAC.2